MRREKRNGYFCQSCRKVTLTVDVDQGITPMFIKCPFCEEGLSHSMNYRIPGCMHVKPGKTSLQPLQVDFEWYKPTSIEIADLSQEEKDFFRNGGLRRRLRTNATPIYH